MKSLLYKDFCILKKLLVTYAVFTLLYGAIMISSGDSMFLGGVILLLAGMMPISAMGGDEQSKWWRFGQILPVSRRQMASEKYLLGLLSVFAGLPVALGLILLARTLRGELTAQNLFADCLLLAVLLVGSLVQIAVSLPFTFWLGVERGRIALIALVCGCMAGGGWLAGSLLETPALLAQIFARPVLLVVLVLAAVAALLAVSWAVSQKLLSKKEFS